MSSSRPSRLRMYMRTVLFMLALTLVFGAAVSALHVFTQPLVERNATLFLKRAVRAAAGLPGIGDPELQAWFAGSVRGLPQGDREPAFYRVSSEAGEAVAYVFVRAGAGLWGQITAAIGIDAGLGGFTGLSIVEQNETPGLGARIAEPWFVGQVRGKRSPLRLVPEKTNSADPQELDAVTGATITSTAVLDLLNGVMADCTNVIVNAEGRQADGQG
ncbi:MAG: FMN-binding protein [Kiritimatiellae bacterium]|nr:FMN-binding protein [Kiritimatiellia bacterium]